MPRSRTPVVLSWVPALLLTLLMALPALPALAAPAPLVLDDAHPHVEGWPAATILHDPSATLLAEALVRQPERFAIPQGAYATAGMHAGASWLRVPAMAAAGGDGAWIFKVDFGLLSHVDFYLVRDGRIVQHGSTGSGRAPQGAMGGPVPAFVMHLQPGVRYEVLLRVESLSAIILPVSFEKPAAFYGASMDEQLLQGALTGLTLCLLLYSLAQWLNLRESLFAKYALLVGGLALYNFTWFGYGLQYLWGRSAWTALHMPGVITLLTAVGGYLFVEHALARPGLDRVFSRMMKTGALACVATALAWCFDLIAMKTVVNVIITLGVLPMLLGLPGAFRRARRGDPVGICFLVGWTVSFTGSAVAGQMCTGVLDVNYWTMHLVEFTSTFDMLVFMRILGLRTRSIQDAMVRAEAATRMKSEFLANMSHEIRTPMNAIIGMSRLALMADPEPRLRNYLSKILGAGEHLLGVINDILDFSKIEAGRLALEHVPFDLDEMLEHLSSITALKTDAKRVELVFSVPRGVPSRLVGDPLRLGQVLINLTNNAVKFTDEGEIVVAVEVLEQTSAAGANEVLLGFSVSDTGIGMDAGQLGRLFESFTQADNSISRKYGGTGLGLSISRQLVELMGGRIEVTSTPGVGSRFSFKVRLSVGADEDATLAAASLARTRVMVVDDSASARQALVEMLAGFGVKAEAVGSGEAALARLAQAASGGQPYHMVLMDYLMPGMDGVEAIRRIRADGRLQAPPAILMVSACTRDSVLQREGDLPSCGFLTKPVGPALLHNSLLQALRPDLARAGAPAGAGAAPPDLGRLDGARILLVDDNANNREVALDFLAAARMQVDVATGGGEAVRMVQQGDYDLVLMDIQMHDVDGLAATRQIRTLAQCAQLPIVAMTAHAMAGDREKSLAAGMNDHVVKPIDPDLMFRTLLKWIDPQRLAGRPLPAPAPRDDHAADAAGIGGALSQLPAPLRGIDWERALANAGGRPARLRHRVDSFLQEYAGAPQRMREALADGRDELLQSLAHNLKSGASYLGAEALAAAAGTLELELRAGRRDHLALLVPDLIVALESILAGLARAMANGAASAAAGDAGDDAAGGTAADPAQHGAAALAQLTARLDAWLLADDARAEDALAALEAALPGPVRAAHGARLDALRRAVRDIEYEAARAHLATLARNLDHATEAQS